MPEPEVTKAQPVFSDNQKAAPSVKPEESKKQQKSPTPKKKLPPQFVVAPDPKTPLGKMSRSLSEIKNNLVLPPVIKTYAPRIAVLVISLILVIALLPFVTKLIGQFKPASTPTPSPVPTAEPSSFHPSPYANDEVILAIEQKINDLENELKSITFREDTLSTPDLDWNVKFE
jgi:hypothetical protein